MQRLIFLYLAIVIGGIFAIATEVITSIQPFILLTYMPMAGVILMFALYYRGKYFEHLRASNEPQSQSRLVHHHTQAEIYKAQANLLTFGMPVSLAFIALVATALFHLTSAS